LPKRGDGHEHEPCTFAELMNLNLDTPGPARDRLADELDVVRERVLAGPNRWRREPAITGDVVPGALAAHPELLRDAMRTVGREVPELQAAGGGEALVDAANDAGAAWANAVATLALALQRMAGGDTGNWRTLAPGDEPGNWAFAIGYSEEGAGLSSVREAARLLRRAMRGDSLRVGESVDYLRGRHEEEALGPKAAAMVAEARRRGIPVRRLPEQRAVQLGHGVHMRRIDASIEEASGDARSLLEGLFPANAPSRIPVVAVTGTNGKTTTTRLVAHLLRQDGHHVGLTTTDGVYVDDELVFRGDMTGPMAADMVLSNPRVDAAALETARGGILRAGLGFDDADVGVVLNVTADHLGLRGIQTVEQLAEVKAVIASAVRPDGYVVLNADDPLVLAMRSRIQARVVLFSLQPLAANEGVAAHVAGGGMAVTLERDQDAGGQEGLVLHRGAERMALASLANIPMTENGAARFQVQNAAAASAAAWACGVAPSTIRDGLARFVPSATTTPGRMNTVRVHDATVIVDYAHNPAAIRALFEYAGRLDADRRIAVLSIPGDRRDDDIREMGALGRGVDEVIFMENPPYRRGRDVGVIGALLLEGFAAAGGDASRTVVVHGQEEGVAEVLRRLRPRDLVLFMADDAEFVIGLLEQSERPAD
jgi:UDP-N-acetylmuramyl tripeptide synthase